MGADIPQATIDKLTDQIIAKIMPVLKDSVSQAIASARASIVQPTPVAYPPSVINTNLSSAFPVPTPIWDNVDGTGRARWIYTYCEPVYANPSVGSVAFRKMVTLPEGQCVDLITIDTGCDRRYSLYINNYAVFNNCPVDRDGTKYCQLQRCNIRIPKTNHILVSVRAENLLVYSSQEPASIVSAVMWDSTNHHRRTFHLISDKSWQWKAFVDYTIRDSEITDYSNSWTDARLSSDDSESSWFYIPKPRDPITRDFSGLNHSAFAWTNSSDGSIGPAELGPLDGAD